MYSILYDVSILEDGIDNVGSAAGSTVLLSLIAFGAMTDGSASGDGRIIGTGSTPGIAACLMGSLAAGVMGGSVEGTVVKPGVNVPGAGCPVIPGAMSGGAAVDPLTPGTDGSISFSEDPVVVGAIPRTAGVADSTCVGRGAFGIMGAVVGVIPGDGPTGVSMHAGRRVEASTCGACHCWVLRLAACMATFLYMALIFLSYISRILA